MPRFKKGSIEAKKYMASIRNKKETVKKTTVKTTTKKPVMNKHTDKKSHNVNVKVVSGKIEHIPLNNVGMELWELEFDIKNLQHKKKVAKTISEKRTCRKL